MFYRVIRKVLVLQILVLLAPSHVWSEVEAELTAGDSEDAPFQIPSASERKLNPDTVYALSNGGGDVRVITDQEGNFSGVENAGPTGSTNIPAQGSPQPQIPYQEFQREFIPGYSDAAQQIRQGLQPHLDRVTEQTNNTLEQVSATGQQILGAGIASYDIAQKAMGELQEMGNTVQQIQTQIESLQQTWEELQSSDADDKEERQQRIEDEIEQLSTTVSTVRGSMQEKMLRVNQEMQRTHPQELYRGQSQP